MVILRLLLIASLLVGCQKDAPDAPTPKTKVKAAPAPAAPTTPPAQPAATRLPTPSRPDTPPASPEPVDHRAKLPPAPVQGEVDYSKPTPDYAVRAKAVADAACSCDAFRCAANKAQEFKRLVPGPADLEAAKSTSARLKRCLDALMPTVVEIQEPAGQGDFVARMSAVADAVCACADIACARLALSPLRELKPDPQHAETAARVGKRIQVCLQKLSQP